MSYSFLGSDLRNIRRALGDATSEAKNYAVSQGLSYVPGGFTLPPKEGTIEKGVKYGLSSYSTKLSAGAQGYISQYNASGAIAKFSRDSGIPVPYVPITTDSAVLGKWAKDQALAWGTSQMKGQIESAKDLFAKQGIPLPTGGFQSPLHVSDGEAWAYTYLMAHQDLLTHPTPEGALLMAQSFVKAQGNAIGIPPELIAASNLVSQWPQDIKGAEDWAVTLGTAYLGQFGVPLVTSFDMNGFLQAAGNFALTQLPGAPSFAMCEATWGALKDGSISYDEAKGLVCGACAWIGGAVGQAFGLPAPLGAFLGNLLGQLLTGPVADALGFGPSDSAKLNAAQAAARKAADAATIVCTDLARATWLQYQHYWQSVQGNLDVVFRANQEWLTPTGWCGQGDGIRLFPESVPGGNSLGYVLDGSGNVVMVKDSSGKEQPMTYAYPVTRYCGDMTGCAYNKLDPLRTYVRSDYALSIEDLASQAKSCPPDKPPALSLPAVQSGCPQVSDSSYGCGAISALAFWNARRYVTPFQVILEMQGAQNQPASSYRNMYAGSPYMYVRNYDQKLTQLEAYNTRYWDSWVHSDQEYLAFIGKVDIAGVAGTQVGECMTPRFARMLMGSLQQAPAASALVQRDLARTVSYVTTAYGIKKHAEELAGNQWAVTNLAEQRKAARAMAARAATMRTAILDAKRRGQMERDLLNYAMLAAGGGALAGWVAARRRR